MRIFGASKNTYRIITMKKEKIVSKPTSVEAQVRSRARNLPIYRCYINKNWEELQYATIFVVRRHANGNETVGQFIVDLKLYGVKMCWYGFNESPLQMDDYLKKNEDTFIECDYHLAHNIIYAGLEFAEDYGFAPHKDFKTAQYILQEDSEDIPLMDIPLGDNGVPVLIIPHGENKLNEMALLEKTAGDNFYVVYLDEDGNPKEDNLNYLEVLDDVIATGVDEYMEKDKRYGDTFTKVQVLTDLIYLAKVNTAEDRKEIGDEFGRITNDPRLSAENFEEDDPFEKYKDLLARYFELYDAENYDGSSAEMKAIIEQHPEEPFFWNLYLSDLSDIEEEVNTDAVKEAYARFPDDPSVKAWYAEWLVQEDRAAEVFELFNNIPDLNALTSENRFITMSQLASFCFAYTGAWLQVDNIRRAEPYYQIISHLGLNHRIGNYVQELMVYLKKKKMREMLDSGQFLDDDKK